MQIILEMYVFALLFDFTIVACCFESQSYFNEALLAYLPIKCTPIWAKCLKNAISALTPYK